MYIGYRRGGVKKGYTGMRFCSSCDLITHHFVYEKSFRPTVMFISVAKFNKSYLIGCAKCEQGYEIEKNTANALIEKSHSIPNKKVFLNIYEEIEQALLKVDGVSGKTWMDKMVIRLLGDKVENDQVTQYLVESLNYKYAEKDILTVYYYFVNAQLHNSSFL